MRQDSIDHRLLRVEKLEPRYVLSGVTLITHGFNSDADGWVTAMASAIGNRTDVAVDVVPYLLEVTDPGHDGGPLTVTSTKLAGPNLADPGTPTPELALLLDWSDVAGTLPFGGYTRGTYDVAAAVADALMTPQFLDQLIEPVASLPLHLIGHSRGGSLVGVSDPFFQLYGTQITWAHQDFHTYDPAAGAQHFVIPLGQFFTGPITELVLAADDDALANAESVFSNLRIFD